MPYGFEFPHPSLPHPGRLMRLLCPIILILFSAVDHFGHQLPVSNSIAAKLVSHDLPGLAAVTPQQPIEEALCRYTIPFCLQEYINNFPVLVDGPPQVMLLSIDLYEDFIDVKSIAISSVLSLQAAGINGAEFDAPEADRFAADDDSSFSE